MLRAQPLFDYARELRRIPPGLTEHPGLRSFELPAVARRLGELADGLEASLPLTAGQLRKSAHLVLAEYGAIGMSGANCIELSTWLGMVGGHVTVLEPDAERAAEAGAA